MAYTPQTWTNGVSKLNATRMGHIETGIADIHNLVDAKGDLYTATAADTPARLAVGADNKVLTAASGQSTGLAYSFVTNSMVDAAAAIAYSKLNLTGSIVNADISGSAAIVASKLATGLSGPVGTRLTHDEYTANVTVSATTEGTANTVVTATSFTADGSTPVLIEFFIPTLQIGSNASGNFCVIVLYQDGSSIGKLGDYGTSIAQTTELPFYGARQLTPASGSRTYSVRAYRTNANCTAVAGSGGSGNYVPGFIRITKAS